MTAVVNSDVPPLAKYLASTDKKTRDKAIKNLSVFLSDPTRDALPTPEMAKLWKGIFYCYWMSDKPLVQQALSTELAQLVLTITSTSASLAFLRGFWQATVREWNGIDRLRMDKYLMLVRKFVNASFRRLIRAEWDGAACEEYNSILGGAGGPLCPNDGRVPAGLTYHICDIYLEELDKALGASTAPMPPNQSAKPQSELFPAPIAILLAPFLTLAACTSTTPTHLRVQSALLEPLFTVLLPASRSSSPPSRKRARLASDSAFPTYSHLVANACLSKPKYEGQVDSAILHKALLEVILEIASREDTRDANRRKMYALWKNYSGDDDEDEN